MPLSCSPAPQEPLSLASARRRSPKVCPDSSSLPALLSSPVHEAEDVPLKNSHKRSYQQSLITVEASSRVSCSSQSPEPSAPSEAAVPLLGPGALTSPASSPAPGTWKAFAIRSLWTLFMIVSFFFILAAGHAYVIFLVVLVQIIVFKEVIDIAHQPWHHKKLPWFRTISWYFLCSTTYFLYGEASIHYFKKRFLLDVFLLPLASHHRFISFSMYILGLVLFVLNLKRGYYKFQFGLFGWTHMALLLVTVQSHFVIMNIMEGLIWFILPVSLVICNDIMAYLFGFFFGRTPLIKVSPKKTWEGFLGAFLSTLLFAYFLSQALSPSSYLTCPLDALTDSGSCDANPIFVPVEHAVPPFLSSLLKHLMPWSSSPFTTISFAPMQMHALAFAVFSSVIAPFGGFFASGVKRAFKIKDFAHSIPGHGGVTDRMDCQFLMGLFSYMYHSSFIKIHRTSVAYVLNLAVLGLSPPEQVELFRTLGEYLANQRIIDPAA